MPETKQPSVVRRVLKMVEEVHSQQYETLTGRPVRVRATGRLLRFLARHEFTPTQRETLLSAADHYDPPADD